MSLPRSQSISGGQVLAAVGCEAGQLGLEVVARECLHRVLGEEELLSWFETVEEIHEFWELDEEKRRRLWGEPLDVVAVEESFREEVIPEEVEQSWP